MLMFENWVTWARQGETDQLQAAAKAAAANAAQKDRQVQMAQS